MSIEAVASESVVITGGKIRKIYCLEMDADQIEIELLVVCVLLYSFRIHDQLVVVTGWCHIQLVGEFDWHAVVVEGYWRMVVIQVDVRYETSVTGLSRSGRLRPLSS